MAYSEWPGPKDHFRVNEKFELSRFDWLIVDCTLIKSMFSLLSCRMSQTEPFLKTEAKNRQLFNCSYFVVKLAKLITMSIRRFRTDLQIDTKICGES